LADLLFLTPSVLLLSLSQHLHLHQTFRLSLLSLSLLATPALQLSLPTVLTLSLVLLSFYFLLGDTAVELSTLLFGLAVGLQQGMVWFVPAFALTMIHKMVSKNTRGGIGMQEINQIMSVISTNMIIAVLAIGLPWIRVAEVLNGLTVVEDTVFRIYLENYPSPPVAQGVIGNLWTLVDAPKNGNLISLPLYFLNLGLTLLTLRSASPLPHRLLLTLYHTSALLLLFSPSPPAFLVPLPLLSLSLLNFSHLTPSLTLLQLLSTISCLPTVACRLATLLSVLAWQYIAMNFQQTVQYLAEKKVAGVVAQDEEGQ